MKKYLNEEKLYFFKKCKWTLEKKAENKEISIGLYLDSKTYLKNFIYKNYRISKKEVSLLIFGHSRIYEYKETF